jgi:hypothetical protein
VEDTRALLVEVAIEDVDGRLVVLADDGPSIAPVRLADVGIVALDAVFVLVAPRRCSRSTCSMNVAKPSLSQRVRPVAAGHQIAEPLVRQLVGDEIVGGDVEAARSSSRMCSYIVVAVVFSMPPKMKSLTTTCAYLFHG